MNAIRPTLTVAAATTLLWRRGISESLSISDRAVRVLSIAFVLLSACVSGLLYLMVNGILGQAEPGAFRGDAHSLLRLVFAGVFLGAVIMLLVLCSSAPERTALGTVLRMTPSTSSARVLGPFLPFVLMGLLSTVILGFPSLAMVFRLGSREAAPVIAVVVFIWLAVWSTATFCALFFIVKAVATRVVDLPPGFSLAISAIVCTTLAFGLSGSDLVPVRNASEGGLWQNLSPTRMVSAVVVDGFTLQSVCVLVTWSAMAAALLVLLARIRERPVTRLFNRVLIGVGFPASRFGARLTVELLLLARIPQFVVAALIAGVGTVLFPLLYLQPTASATVDELAAAIVVVPSALGLYAYGPARAGNWVATTVTGRRDGWVVPKAVAVAILSSALVAPYLLAMAWAGLPFDRLVDVASLGIAMSACSQLVGVLLPCEPGRSLAATASTLSLSLTWAIVVIGPRWIAAQFHVGPDWMVTVGASALVLTAYFVLAFTARVASAQVA